MNNSQILIDPTTPVTPAIQCNVNGQIVTKNVFMEVPGPASACLIDGTAPPTQVTFVDGTNSWEFAAAADDIVHFDYVIPRRQAQGTVIIPRIRWSPTTTINAHMEVCWAIEYSFAIPGAVFATTETVRANGICTGSHVYEELDLPSIPASVSSGIDLHVKARLYRDVSEDNYVGAAALHSCNLLVACDAIGSTSATAK